jgi:rare lipoprotein A
VVKLLLLAGAAYLFWPRSSTASPTSAPLSKRGEVGIASWYGPGYYGNKTANGETFTGQDMTAAHKTLPFNTRVRVVDVATGRSVEVRINDRGPFVPGRIIDLSEKAAESLGIKNKGIANVRVERV